MLGVGQDFRLHFCGGIGGSTCPAPIQKKTQRLQRHERRWAGKICCLLIVLLMNRHESLSTGHDYEEFSTCFNPSFGQSH